MLFIVLFVNSVFALDDCDSSSYWDQANGKCEKCPSPCTSCWSKTMCTSCKIDEKDEMKSYYLDDSYNCLQRDTANCSAYDGLYCIQCNSGYYISNMQCHKCTLKDCDICTSRTCFKCKKGLTLYEYGSTQECVDCTLAENDEKCGRCQPGKYFNISSFRCEACREDCLRCTTSTNCYLCDGEKNLALEDPSNPESKCTKISNCEDNYYYGNHCEMCVDGYYLVNGRCKPCGDGCERCIDANTCVECKDGATLSNGKCSVDLNCVKSSNIMGCIECKRGYYLDESTSLCAQCPESCSSCLNETYCFTCSSEYYFTDVEKGVCSPRQGNCHVVDQYGCLQCKYDVNPTEFIPDDFSLTDSKAEMKKELEAASVEFNDATLDNYKFGYFLEIEENGVTDDSEGNRVTRYKPDCKMCNPRCRICEYNESWCTGCNEGYYLEKIKDDTVQQQYRGLLKLGVDDNSYVSQCVPQPPECKKTEMGYCIECSDEYFLSGLECTRCHESCDACINDQYCVTCNSTVGDDDNALWWRKPSLDKNEGVAKGYCEPVNVTEMNCKGPVTTRGCSECYDGWYRNEDDGICYPCDPRCRLCVSNSSCTGCAPETEYLGSDNWCQPCSDIEHCGACNTRGCSECLDGYKVSSDRMKCTKLNLALVISLVIVGLFIIVVIIIVIVVIVWLRHKKVMREREKEIKPFKVNSAVEMALLSADNEKFPLKTNGKWQLDFGCAGSKALIDKEYEQTFSVVNDTKKSYFFEVLLGASHRYELKAEPMRYTLKPGNGIDVKFTIKMLCTAVVKDEIGIVAMDMDEELKETAKITVLIESDLSMKLDHTELQLQLPAIGEGAFGMVFVGTYRQQKVAVKKMKARNLTEEQEREFKHEVDMLTQYRHQCIVNLVGAVYTEGEIAIVTEFAEYGSLSKIWGKETISFDLKVKFMEDAVVALAFLHQNQIIHRDVKGENILIYSLNPHSPVCGKLTDFGTCRNISPNSLAKKELSQGIGTPTYMAPECLQNANYSFSADVYSFSMVLYETYTEKQAFIDDERFNQPWMIPQFVIEGKRLEKPEGMRDDYWELINKCWDQEPNNRPTFIEIYKTFVSWNLDINNTEMAGADFSVDVASHPTIPDAPQESGSNEPSQPGAEQPVDTPTQPVCEEPQQPEQPQAEASTADTEQPATTTSPVGEPINNAETVEPTDNAEPEEHIDNADTGVPTE